MSIEQRNKFLENAYKIGFMILLGMCTYLIKDIHGDFKEAVHELRTDVKEIEKQIGDMKVEVGVIKMEVQTTKNHE